MSDRPRHQGAGRRRHARRTAGCSCACSRRPAITSFEGETAADAVRLAAAAARPHRARRPAARRQRLRAREAVQVARADRGHSAAAHLGQLHVAERAGARARCRCRRLPHAPRRAAGAAGDGPSAASRSRRRASAARERAAVPHDGQRRARHDLARRRRRERRLVQPIVARLRRHSHSSSRSSRAGRQSFIPTTWSVVTSSYLRARRCA